MISIFLVLMALSVPSDVEAKEPEGFLETTRPFLWQLSDDDAIRDLFWKYSSKSNLGSESI